MNTNTKAMPAPVSAPDANTFAAEAETFIGAINTAFSATIGPKAQDAVFTALGSGSSGKGRPQVQSFLAAIAILSDSRMNYDRRAQLCRLANKAQATRWSNLKLDGTGAAKLTRVCPEAAKAGVDSGTAKYKLNAPVALAIDVSAS